MKKLLAFSLWLLALLPFSTIHGQVRFEKGYFIDLDGATVPCLIKNTDWIYTPVSFEYKMDSLSEKAKKSVEEVREFGIGQGIRYISAKVKIDTSSDELTDGKMSINYEPEWKDVHVFLKILVSGQATLYLYDDHDRIRFFFKSTENDPIEQLVFKRFRRENDPVFQVNNHFQNQLFSKVNCVQWPIKRFEGQDYNAIGLVKWFIKHNECADPGGSSFVAAKKRKLFLPKLVVGSSYLSYRTGVSSDPTLADVKFDPKLSLLLGVELEYIFPFQANKFSLFAEGTTMSHKTSGRNSNGDLVRIDYHTVNIMIGLRYRAFINDKIRVLGDIGANRDINDLRFKINPTLGLGVEKGRFLAQARVYFQKAILHEYYYETEGERLTHLSLSLKVSLVKQ